jgi:hypothetical protein
MVSATLAAGMFGLAERMLEDAAKGEIEDGGPDKKDQHK